MNCVCLIKYLVKCNASLSKVVRPSRGLRRGDSLSPYLFLFCMDALSRLLLEAQNNGILRGIQVCQNNPHINHLFFADNALLFIKNKEDVEATRTILQFRNCLRSESEFFKISFIL